MSNHHYPLPLPSSSKHMIKGHVLPLVAPTITHFMLDFRPHFYRIANMLHVQLPLSAHSPYEHLSSLHSLALTHAPTVLYVCLLPLHPFALLPRAILHSSHMACTHPMHYVRPMCPMFAPLHVHALARCCMHYPHTPFVHVVSRSCACPIVYACCHAPTHTSVLPCFCTHPQACPCCCHTWHKATSQA